LLLVAAAPDAHAQAEPRRIVSIGGAATEVLYALGLQDSIAGVDTTSVYPEEALRTKPNVGYLRALSAEGVLALSPDLILMEADAGPPEAVDLLQQARIPVVRIPTGYGATALPDKIRTIAEAVGRPAE